MLLSDQNIIARNKKFKDKKCEIYSKSDLKINKSIIKKYKKWTAKEVECREVDFYKYADKIWDLNDFLKKNKN